MKYNPKIHKRKSIRLKGYDYSQKGLYFVTIVCKNRAHMFGNIIDGKMILNDAGKMVQKWYYELENKFPDIKCGEMIIMPNHFHCIIENIGNVVGADLCVSPDLDDNPNCKYLDDSSNCKYLDDSSNCNKSNKNPNAINKNKLHDINISDGRFASSDILGEHIGSPLHRVVQWFKTMSTNEYIRNVKSNNWKRFDGKLWQRNYWEHIIRNEKSHLRICEYMKSNPQNWEKDTLK